MEMACSKVHVQAKETLATSDEARAELEKKTRSSGQWHKCRAGRDHCIKFWMSL